MYQWRKALRRNIAVKYSATLTGARVHGSEVLGFRIEGLSDFKGTGSWGFLRFNMGVDLHDGPKQSGTYSKEATT